VAVDGAIVPVTEIARQRLGRPLRGDFRFEGVKLLLILQAELVDEDGGAWIAVRIGLRLVHRRSYPLL
jgi:hypothetical protein